MSGRPSSEVLQRLGIFTYEALAELAISEQECRIDRLVPTRSIGLRIGDSGLGKTALSMMEAICVAAGTRFLGFDVKPGRVLYCDAESGVAECQRTIKALADFLGLEAPPANLYVWSPYFDPREPSADQTPADVLCEQVEALRPDHIIVDPLRAFWPEAEDRPQEAMAMFRRQRLLSKDIGCSWTVNHHRRKRNHQNLVSLENDRHVWFEEAAGSLALINGSDVRLGLERTTTGRGDLVVAGFVRSVGWLGSRRLERVHDDQGEPKGYRLLTGIDQLNPHYRGAFDHLAARFRFRDAHAALGGTSDSGTSDFLKQCSGLGILRKEGKEYVKVE